MPPHTPTPIVWDSSFTVGNELLDTHHKSLLAISRDILFAIQSGRTDLIHDLLDEMANYTRGHFAAEEALLRRAGYEVLDEHMELHTEFIEQLAEWCNSAIFGGVDLVQMQQFIQNWWVGHILHEDMHYKECLAKAGLA